MYNFNCKYFFVLKGSFVLKIAVMCDMHLPECADALQYAYFREAVADIKATAPDITIVAGDTAGYGEKAAFDCLFSEMAELPYILMLGNSDVRAGDIESCGKTFGGKLQIGKRKILCINTHSGDIPSDERAKADALCDGDVLILHHDFNGLCDSAKEYMYAIAGQKELTIIHAHLHYFKDYTIGRSRVISLGALDPDKSNLTPPVITYFEITETDISINERYFTTKKPDDFREHLGISCFDVTRNFAFAKKFGIKNLELRKYAENDGLFDFTLENLKDWRKNGGKELSIHMPELHHNGGVINPEGWEYAIKLACATGVTSVTIHPPRATIKEMKTLKPTFAKYYADVIKRLPSNAKVGFENLHMSAGDTIEERNFGYTPFEIAELIDAVNEQFGFERVGAVIDVGHARNNPPYNSIFVISSWYAMLGKKVVAYHIHQVTHDVETGYHNHCAIKNWFGPLISYSSFMRAWSIGQINHRPAFLEISADEALEQSVTAYDNIKEF